MRKRCRSRVPGQRVLNPYSRMVAHFGYAQSSLQWRDWTFRLISQRQAQMLVSLGEAEAVTRMSDGHVRVVGYRALKPTSWERPSPCTLTLSTMQAVADAGDAAGLTRRQRAEVTKFRVWALIGDTKAVAVRPRISEQERRLAESLLGGKAA